jgi:hypothetical protein
MMLCPASEAEKRISSLATACAEDGASHDRVLAALGGGGRAHRFGPPLFGPLADGACTSKAPMSHPLPAGRVRHRGEVDQAGEAALIGGGRCRHPRRAPDWAAP